MNTTTKLMTVLSLSTSLLFSSISSAAPYVGVQGGVGHGYPLDLGVKKDQKFGPTGRLSLGYLFGDLNNGFNLGAEIGAQGYNSVKHTYGSETLRSKRFALDLMAVANLNLGETFNIFAKGGVAHVHPHFDVYSDNAGELTLESAIKPKAFYTPKLAVGFGGNVSPQVNLNLSLNQELKKDHLRGVTSILAGLNFTFA